MKIGIEIADGTNVDVPPSAHAKTCRTADAESNSRMKGHK
jgi:hypothetical protein